MIQTNCNYTCWECSKDCEMKTMMENLSEVDFNYSIVQSMKANAGYRQSVLHWTNEQALDFVMKNSVALSIARKKYLETLQNS